MNPRAQGLAATTNGDDGQITTTTTTTASPPATSPKMGGPFYFCANDFLTSHILQGGIFSV
jgi:hypothetical protein